LDKHLKILTFFPHHGLSMSGGERSFFEILKRWVNLGHQIHIVTTEDGHSVLEKQNLKFVPYVYRFPKNVQTLSWYITVLKSIQKIPKLKFDFIYSNEPFTTVIPAFVAKSKTKAPLVVVFKLLEDHEVGFASCFKNPRYERQVSFFGSVIEAACLLLRNLIAKRTDLVLIVSSYYKQLLTKVGVDSGRIYTIYHGVDLDQISSIRLNGDESFDACFMGGLVPRKGIFDLVIAWKRVVSQRPSARLAIIGTGEKIIVEKLNALIGKLGLEENIVQTGWLNNEKYRVLKNSKMFVFPSYGEGFALAVCEAMACGLPVVAYDLAAYDTIYKKGMIRIDIGDTEKLADAILDVLENKTLRRRLGLEATEQAKQYDWENSAKAQLGIITRFLDITK